MNRSEHRGHVIEVEKFVERYAYPRNGNVHNPTPYYRWEARVDGRVVTASARRKSDAIATAQLFIDGGEA